MLRPARQEEEKIGVAKPPSKNKITARAWQRMLSGRRLDLLDPSPLDVEIEDIAHGLARVARWNGQTTGAHIFSVAQHTLLVDAVPRADDGGWHGGRPIPHAHVDGFDRNAGEVPAQGPRQLGAVDGDHPRRAH